MATPKNAQSKTNFFGLSFQMGVIIFLSTFGGLKLDEKLGVKPILTILFALLSVILTIYYVIYKYTNKKSKK